MTTQNPLVEIIKDNNPAVVLHRASGGKITVDQTGVLGAGCYANVYAISETQVIKYVRNSDPAYSAWLNFCLEHQDNPHIPKIYKVLRFSKKSMRHQAIVIMERLTRINYDGREEETRVNDFIDLCSGFKKCTDPSIREIALALEKFSRRYCDDLAGNNLMIRSPGNTLVVTDPIC